MLTDDQVRATVLTEANRQDLNREIHRLSLENAALKAAVARLEKELTDANRPGGQDTTLVRRGSYVPNV